MRRADILLPLLSIGGLVVSFARLRSERLQSDVMPHDEGHRFMSGPS